MRENKQKKDNKLLSAVLNENKINPQIKETEKERKEEINQMFSKSRRNILSQKKGYEDERKQLT